VPKRRPSPIPRLVSVVPSTPIAEPVAPSLPPAPVDGALTPSLEATRKKYAPMTHALLKKRALIIVAMRQMGHTTEQIAKELGVLPGSVASILWRAGKYGFLQDLKSGSFLDSPSERLEYELSHKAVKNLSEMLDSDVILERGQKSVKMETTFEMAKGILFKKFDTPKEASHQTMNALKIEIVMPTSGMGEARAGSMGGTPAFTEAKIEGEE
jgi:hypothetical protein